MLRAGLGLSSVCASTTRSQAKDAWTCGLSGGCTDTGDWQPEWLLPNLSFISQVSFPSHAHTQLVLASTWVLAKLSFSLSVRHGIPFSNNNML